MTEPSAFPRIRRPDRLSEADVDGLARVLLDCVEGGASVSFMAPFDFERARGFFERVAADVARGTRVVLIADDEDGVAGTVQLILDLPENQPHRADLAKMLVHRRARGRGIGDALLDRVETEALRVGRPLLVLDTGSAAAAKLYERHGWVKVGTVPEFALWPEGGFCDTTFYYRRLA
jgi:GNAT superfamily N-acetyltransferase